ncbi:hypothetical protein TWF730_005894 [Orbilia blumenaviensis]|uniref:Uncharacterized protein n=1 Tax=Orbilia blumenaviensis TaxID=1796055 RepID=A0AAV9VKU9_9PEZI
MEDEQLLDNLPSGTYTIINATDPSRPIGRKPAEDKSLHPKGIYVLKPEEGGQNSVWQVENIGGGGYTLKCNKAPTEAHDFRVWAILTDDEPSTVWKLKKSERSPGGYVITNKNDPIGPGWIVRSHDPEQDTPVEVQILVVGPSQPPFYPLTELFQFKKYEEEE